MLVYFLLKLYVLTLLAAVLHLRLAIVDPFGLHLGLLSITLSTFSLFRTCNWQTEANAVALTCLDDNDIGFKSVFLLYLL